MLYRVCQKGRTPKKLHNLGYLIMEHEDNFFFWFPPFVNVQDRQELLEVTTKLPVKLNDLVTDVSTLKGAINRYPKIPFTNTFEIRFFVSVKYDENWCVGSSFQTRQHC
jgi:hypothetical protein